MNISRFSIAEMFNNSKGKTSVSLVSGFIMILTGCFIGIKGSFTSHSETLIHGVAYATIGATLLGLRRFTADKEIQPVQKES